jgi:type II secretory pathway pseudopilin PulG
LSLLELLLALMITVMVAAAIAGMLGAVSNGVGARRDTRSLMVLGDAAEVRLSAYIAPCRCALDVDSPTLVIWLDDSRESDTVHATEIRWLTYDAASHAINVAYVHFPQTWTQAAMDLEDHEYPSNSNWAAVRATYEANGWLATQTLIDTVNDVTIRSDNPSDLDCRHITYELAFESETGPAAVTVSATIRQHQQPVS